MDDVNTPKTMPETIADNGSEPDLTSSDTGHLQTLTKACSEMKAHMTTEAEQIVSGTAKLGKHPTLTEACSTMKAEMATEAQQLLGLPLGSGKSQTIEAACADFRTEIASEARQMFPSAEEIARSQAEASAVMKNDLTTKAEGIANSSEDPDLPEQQQIEQAKQALKEDKWFEQ
ncbi:hypothetical protein [Chamaesiphon sp. GL140_3_metabinner_50]|uniref:hypothetical protein n=1 Tax=Chamaesiphon sp. GL140_3_metabinner_50 TaxID=2970812 RepID=UPI0025DDD1CC|nr:hypothetical protein [Chamaesiphon sp. GL140_3_metabinner_50]